MLATAEFCADKQTVPTKNPDDFYSDQSKLKPNMEGSKRYVKNKATDAQVGISSCTDT